MKPRSLHLASLLACIAGAYACGSGGGAGTTSSTTTTASTGGGGSSSSTGTTSSTSTSTSTSSGAGGGSMCDPESYVPAWAKNVAPDLEVYVSPSGDDGNDGSKGKPLKTTAAAMKKLAPGVRLNFGAGTYDCNLLIQGFAGSQAKPGVIFSSDGPLQAKFACNPSDAGIYMSLSSGVIIDGVELSGGSGHAIQLDSGSPFDPNNLSHDVVIMHSFIHDPGCAPIKMSQANHIWVVGNELAHPGTCAGIQRQFVELVAVDDTVVVGNKGHDGYLFNEVKGGARRALIALNQVYDNTNGILVGGDGTGYAFLVDDTVDFEASQVVVWGNVIAAPAATEAFRVVACHDCLVANNTFFANAPPAILRILPSNFGNGGPDVHNANLRVIDNVFATTQKPGDVVIAGPAEPASAVTFSHNLWFASAGSLQGAYSDIPFLGEPTSIYDADPQLAADLTPKAGSPVLGAGTALPEVPGNAKGMCWSGPPDIGAY